MSRPQPSEHQADSRTEGQFPHASSLMPHPSPAPFAVYDHRTDMRNVVVTPEVRGRFLRMEPGEVGPFHSHDVGHEVFLVLEGRAEFEIEGHRAVVGPGQLCLARAGQRHEVRVVGEEPMTLFLTVTPHLEPTHTFWTADGEKLPPVYGSWTPGGHADQTPPPDPLPALAARSAAATRALAEAIATQAAAQEAAIAMLERAVAADDHAGAKSVVDDLWESMRATCQRFHDLAYAWNELALRTGQEFATE
jgi:quercetin dioxygenase-like cupin family protein